MKTLKYSILTLMLGLFIISCEDVAPTEYTPKYIVQGLLIVGEPINDIALFQTQSLRDSFIYDNSIFKTADVKIIGDNRTFQLVFDNNSKRYIFSDTTYKVKELTHYSLEIKTPDGKMLTSKTYTPKSINWIKRPEKTIQYPLDTINLPSNYKISWTKSDTIQFYLIRIRPLDTLEYGKYLNPTTEEKNRRIMRSWIRRPEYYFRETTNWAFLPTTEVPVVWNSFKWYGLSEVRIYAPDANYLKWTLQSFAVRDFNQLLNSIEGDAFGTFGSAATSTDTTFVLKNQP